MPRGKPNSGHRASTAKEWADDNAWMDSLRPHPDAEPIHALLRAVLIRAVRDAAATYFAAKTCSSLPTKEQSVEAFDWIMEESDGNVPFSAQWICDTLEIPISSYRKGTRKAIENKQNIPGLENYCSGRRTLGV